MSTLGEKIRKIRTLKGFSQEYMSGKLAIKQPQYSDLEKIIDVDNQHFTKICEILEMTKEEIINLNDSNYFVNHFENKAPHNQNFINNQVINESTKTEEALKKSISLLEMELKNAHIENERLLKVIEILSKKK
jgi:transcriptional regulator with XRE-family HTH domain